MDNEKKTSNSICPMPVKDILGMKFFIPNYQRRYKWKEPQVEDLLNDIKDSPDNELYCLQPLVVRERSENEYEVIDGQQRLTTIFLILKYLDSEDLYKLNYDTRKELEKFLSEINNTKSNNASNNIDFIHISEANKTIKKWFNPHQKNPEFSKTFKDKLKNDVYFIWYELDDYEEKGEEIFKRLNRGKISLTDGELIKALFLHRNEPDKNERAKKWNEIENKFQDEKFWMWICGKGYKSPTRIDFIFELICECDDNLKKILKGIKGEEHKIFRFFYEYFNETDKKEENIKAVWNEVIDIFNVFNAWYEDTELYNYVGYLLDSKIKSMDPKIDVPILLKKWRDLKDKKSQNEAFKKECINLIKEKLEKNGCQNLATQYELDSKRNCIPLLFLHNIQTSVNEKKKFEFSLFRKTEWSDWQVEHIDPETPNDLSGNDVKGWLEYQKQGIDDKALLEMIDKFIDGGQKEESDFEQIIKKLESNLKGSGRLTEEQKNRIDNFALLDKKTNIKNSNKLFSQKCDIVNGKTDYKPGFVPICTQEVFKDSDSNKNKPYWYESDAKNYRADMLKKLKIFGVYCEEEK